MRLIERLSTTTLRQFIKTLENTKRTRQGGLLEDEEKALNDLRDELSKRV